ncbi:NAD(P)-binding domain-containing protein [Actinomadura sp. 9N407]|uniref:NAD(P)-binding domain-containing protein n=1 Tax=Actinomadura sp. 9N407 TaxID=3375154 RepID=UPI00379C1D71
MDVTYDVAIIGAGQAGLSAGYFLRRAGLDFVMFDHAPLPGGAWQYRWPTLTLGATHNIHDLPGMPMGERDASRPASEVVSEYFDRYEREFGLDVRRPVDVTAVRNATEPLAVRPDRPEPTLDRDAAELVVDRNDPELVMDPTGSGLVVETSEGDYAARTLINASGTWDRPFVPYYPGQGTFRGRQFHTAGYRGPDDFAGARVVVVGGGASATQALMEIAEKAAETTWVTRRPPVWIEGPFDQESGRQAVARVEDRVRRGLPPGSVVGATGLVLTPEIRAARESGVLHRLPMFERLTPTGVAWADGTAIEADVVLWATGFRAALDHLAPLRLRGPGGGIRMDGTSVAGDPRVHLLGYGPSASTIGAGRAARTAVRDIKALLAPLPLASGA